MHIKNLERDNLKYEYDLYAQRNFPWKGVVNPPFGGAWCVLPPNQQSSPHNHDEKEVFIIVKGVGKAQSGDEYKEVKEGDTVYFTPFTEHSITNIGEQDLEFVSIWWDGSAQEENSSEFHI
ncbi:cupin domain-containing protein [Alteribacillus sp. HJP-4]|uniref:cupin domain-containing protein n=1 Tax=Alteribacillus sp. HJP-4 TaxID=2775394 RepID=UPI0035CD116B